MVNFNNKYIYVTGGCIDEKEIKTVSRYNIKQDAWELAPNLNQARYFHSSCTLGGMIYVTCG